MEFLFYLIGRTIWVLLLSLLLVMLLYTDFWPITPGALLLALCYMLFYKPNPKGSETEIRLQRLDAMKADGKITEEEYAEHRHRILNEL